MSGLSGVVMADHSTSADSSTTADDVEIDEHRTESGSVVHTIVLPPEDVSETGGGEDVIGIGVIPERDRVCQAVAGESYEAASAGCMTNGSTVDAYLDDTGIERLSGGDYMAG